MNKIIETNINEVLSKIYVTSLIGKNTLIIGEVKKGKTRFTAKIISDLINFGYKDVTVIDLAPEAGVIGRRINSYISNFGSIRYLYPPKIFAPRLYAKDLDELKSYILHNYKESLKLFELFLKSPTDILVVNDLSIFLHHGESSFIINVLRFPNTFIGNSYYGETLKENYGMGLDRIEKSRLNEIMRYMDNIIKLV